MSSSKDNQITVYTLSGEAIHLSNPIAQGGEASIYRAKPDVLVKIFERDSVTIINKYKIFAMTENTRFPEHKKKDSPFSFPLIPLMSKPANNDFQDIIGYAMYEKKGATLHSLINFLKIQNGDVLQNTSRLDLVNMLIDVLKAFNALHKDGLIVGDVSLRNILFDEKTKKIAIIDNDSFQCNLDVPAIHVEQVKHLYKNLENKRNDKFKLTKEKATELYNTTKNVPFFCEVCTDEYTAPELNNVPLNKTPRPIYVEYFALAVLIFQVLMLGKHPLVSKKETDVRAAISNMEFPYKLEFWEQNDDIPDGNWAIQWSHLPAYIKETFIKTFDKETLSNPEKRVNIDEWLEVLTEYAQYLEKTKTKNVLIYSKMATKPRATARKQEFEFNTDAFALSLDDLDKPSGNATNTDDENVITPKPTRKRVNQKVDPYAM